MDDFSYVSELRIFTIAKPLSDVLRETSKAKQISIQHGPEHLMEIVFENHRRGKTADLRPELPLVIYW